ncbi:MAG TPA: transcriptional repressor [Solirubrobacteraceae bacterium]|nr:transcriptional repressor [Solirubrobacteraceae bacterium]
MTSGNVPTLSLSPRPRPPGRASIYRVLDRLVEHGLAERVEVGDGQARCERQQPGGEHHHHIVCEGCGRLIAFDDPAWSGRSPSFRSAWGCESPGHDILLRGACGHCA